MNLFVLDLDPIYAAQAHCDKHVPKMVVEVYQQLGSALRRHGVTDDQLPLTKSGKPLKGGYPNHPCTRWVGDSVSNFQWAVWYGKALCAEYSLRFGKKHFCEAGIYTIGEIDVEDLIGLVHLTPRPQAMPDEYRSEDVVEAYRAYYVAEKAYFAKWERGRQAPDWWPKDLVLQA